MLIVYYLIVKLLKNISDEELVYEYYEGIVMVGGGGLRLNLKKIDFFLYILLILVII